MYRDQTQRPLSLQDLASFLQTKFKLCDRTIKVTTHELKIFATDDVKWNTKLANHLRFLRNKLEKLNAVEDSYQRILYGNRQLSDILKNAGMAVVETVGHIGIIQKWSGAENLWGIYVFSDDGTIELEKGTMDTIQARFLSFSTTKKDRAVITGYMVLP